ncbi:MAG TPA: hypothetical protein VGH53_30680 [Streptosporangiaceae bacterium]|jgi:hypothetical protein
MSAVAGSTQDPRPRRQDCSTAGNITRSLGYLGLTIVAVDLYRRTRTADPGRTAVTQPVPSPQGK